MEDFSLILTANLNVYQLKTTSLILVVGLFGAANFLHAQSLGVPLYSMEQRVENMFETGSDKLRNVNGLFSEAKVREQLKRANCTLALPAPLKKQLSGREIWAAARAAHLRVGWNFHCCKCDKWHLDLAGGYAITKDGAVSTCYHVVKPPPNFKEGGLVVADEEGNFFPVTEILAANESLDVCILRVTATNLKPVPLNTDVAPGDRAFCFSDPFSERGYFSEGIVNRFLSRQKPQASSVRVQTRLNVTTDWAPGSSGSAVLDECGNAIGHVTSISTMAGNRAPSSGSKTEKASISPTLITLHEAVSARDVKALIRDK